MWDPDVYLAFADYRSRPFYDLVSRVGAERARRVADLGCGPGHLTNTCPSAGPARRSRLWTARRRWSRPLANAGSTPATGDLRTWKPKPDTDVVVSNAALHWVPEHADLMVRWAQELAPGSWIAVQVPGNFETPSHSARDLGPSRTLCKASARHTVPSRGGGPSADALRRPADGRRVPGRRLGDTLPAPADWRAPRAGLDHRYRAGPGPRAARRRRTGNSSAAGLIPLLNDAYPPRADGTTIFPFRRVFVVAQVGAA